MKGKIAPGDYVLATKYHDGGPRDHFVVGFFSRMLCDRFIVVDDKGVPFRANGFRRAKKISGECGAFLVTRMRDIESGSWSVWGIQRKWKWLRGKL